MLEAVRRENFTINCQASQDRHLGEGPGMVLQGTAAQPQHSRSTAAAHRSTSNQKYLARKTGCTPYAFNIPCLTVETIVALLCHIGATLQLSFCLRCSYPTSSFYTLLHYSFL